MAPQTNTMLASCLRGGWCYFCDILLKRRPAEILGELVYLDGERRQTPLCMVHAQLWASELEDYRFYTRR